MIRCVQNINRIIERSLIRVKTFIAYKIRLNATIELNLTIVIIAGLFLFPSSVRAIDPGIVNLTSTRTFDINHNFTSQANYSIDLTVNANEDCYNVYNDGSKWGWDAGSPDVTAGYYSPHYQESGSGLRFTNVDISQGAIIMSAYLTFTARLDTESSGTRTRIIGDKEPDAAAFGTLADYQSRRGTDVGGADNTKRTTSEVSWDNIEPWLPGNQYNSPDISSVIQEIVDQPGWTSGNHLALFWDDHEGRSDTVWYAARDGYSYRGSVKDVDSSIDSPVLHIVYLPSSNTTTLPAATTSVLPVSTTKTTGISTTPSSATTSQTTTISEQESGLTFPWWAWLIVGVVICLLILIWWRRDSTKY
jgi:hypothetical protein